jgi:hypothetical protein
MARKAVEAPKPAPSIEEPPNDIALNLYNRPLPSTPALPPPMSETAWASQRKAVVGALRDLTPRAVRTLDRLMVGADKDEVSMRVALAVLSSQGIQTGDSSNRSLPPPASGAIPQEIATAFGQAIAGLGYMAGSKAALDKLADGAMRVVREKSLAASALGNSTPQAPSQKVSVRNLEPPSDDLLSSGLSPDLEAALMEDTSDE